LLSAGVRDLNERWRLDRCGRDRHIVLHHVEDRICTGIHDIVETIAAQRAVEENLTKLGQLR
jgi:hypothetical protein